MIVEELRCPKCCAESLVKKGFVSIGGERIQNYICTSCGYSTTKPLDEERFQHLVQTVYQDLKRTEERLREEKFDPEEWEVVEVPETDEEPEPQEWLT